MARSLCMARRFALRSAAPIYGRVVPCLALLLPVLLLPAFLLTPPAALADEARTPEGTSEPEWQITERGGGTRGGEVAVALTAEPGTYMPLLANDTATRAVVQRLHAGLVRRDGESFEMQPALATSWTVSPDHRQVTLELRRGVRFSDGEPFDADDVVFSIRAAQDPDLGSAQRDLFVLDGEPVTVEALGTHRVRLTFPVPIPSPIWLLNDFAVLPEHRLAAAWREGRLADAWSLGTDPAELAGLGPFRLARHEPGRRLVLERNEHYWRRDRPAPDGVQLPYLDRLVFLLVADENAKLLRFRGGETHLLERVPGDDFEELEARSRAGAPIDVRDLGAGLGFTFVVFNLNEVEHEEVTRRQGWMRQAAFRRAVSLAVDRRAISRLVYRGHATPVVSGLSPGNTLYWDAALEPSAWKKDAPDLGAAREILRGAGFTRDAEGFWLDEGGERVELTLVTNTSNRKRSAIATLLQEDLRRLGLDVTFVGLEFSALVERLTQSLDYDLLLLEFGSLDLDPNSSLNIWRVGGGNHFFHLGSEAAAFPWEAEVDRLMERQTRELDRAERRRLYLEAQKILAREVPMVFLVAPNVLVAAHENLGNFAPSILEHPTLWNSDELFWPADAPRRPAAGPR